MKKKHRQQNKQTAFDDDMTWLMSVNQDTEQTNIHSLFFDAPTHDRNTVSHRSSASRAFDDIVGTARSRHASTMSRLPVNAERKVFNGYEEIHVPPLDNVKERRLREENLVHIKSLPTFAHGCFKGYKTLNTIQSKIYGTAMYKDENVLVCAPTGMVIHFETFETQCLLFVF